MLRLNTGAPEQTFNHFLAPLKFYEIVCILLQSVFGQSMLGLRVQSTTSHGILLRFWRFYGRTTISFGPKWSFYNRSYDTFC